MIGSQIGAPRSPRSDGIDSAVDVGDPVVPRDLGGDEVPPDRFITSGSTASAAITRPGNSGEQPTAGSVTVCFVISGLATKIALGPFGEGQTLPQRQRGDVVRLELDGHVPRHPVDGCLAHPEHDTVGVGHAAYPEMATISPDLCGTITSPHARPPTIVGPDADIDHAPVDLTASPRTAPDRSGPRGGRMRC